MKIAFSNISSASRYAFLALLGLLIAITWLPITDHIADADIDKGFHRALTAFALAKSFNMIISVFQSVQIGALGFSMTIGEILDPINDLVEQFSNIMLFASVAFGIQKILVAVGGHFLVKISLTLAAIAVGLLTFAKKDVPRWIKSVLIIFVLARLAIPAATLGSSAAYSIFLEDADQTSLASLNSSTNQIELLVTANQLSGSAASSHAAPPPSNDGWLSKAKSAATSIATLNPNDAILRAHEEFTLRKEKVVQLSEKMTKDITTQIVVFLLQTLFFPIGLIWVLYKISVSLMYRSRSS